MRALTATLAPCKKLVKSGPVTLEFKRAKIEYCAATRPQFDDRPSFGTLAFRNGLENYNFYFIGRHFSTSCKMVSCTALVDNFTTLNSATFAREAGLLGTVMISN